MMKQRDADAVTLVVGQHRDVLDQQASRLGNELDQRDVVVEIDDVLGNRDFVVRGHRPRLAPDQRDPFRVGGPHDPTHERGIRRYGTPHHH